MGILLSVELDSTSGPFVASRAPPKYPIRRVSSLDSALDVLWERGREIDEVVLSEPAGGTPGAKEFFSIMKKDWPNIKVTQRS